MSEVEIIKELNLDYVYLNQWAVIPVSALQGTNLDNAIDWLAKKGKKYYTNIYIYTLLYIKINICNLIKISKLFLLIIIYIDIYIITI